MDQITSISVFLLLMVLLLPLFEKLLKRFTKMFWASKVFILASYLYANLRLTLIGRKPYQNHILKMPFWAYGVALRGSIPAREDIILNILLYVPLGYLLHFTFPALKGKWCILIGFLFSCATESIQLLFKLGFCEFDDVLNNTLGTVIGVVCSWGMKKLLDRNQQPSRSL